MITEVAQPDEDADLILAPDPDAVPGTPPGPIWWVRRKGTPITRHVTHKTLATKTACKLSLSRFRAADAEEITHLGVCSACLPVGQAKKQARRR